MRGRELTRRRLFEALLAASVLSGLSVLVVARSHAVPLITASSEHALHHPFDPELHADR